MTPVDVQLFTATLNGLAEVFGNRAVPPKAIEIWFDALREFESARVVSSLRGWAKTHAKFPAPIDVWKALNEDATRHREQADAAEKQVFKQAYVRLKRSPETQARWQAMLDTVRGPRPTPADHWKRVLKTPGFSPIAYRAAESFMGLRAVQREPGQDDEERV